MVRGLLGWHWCVFFLFEGIVVFLQQALQKHWLNYPGKCRKEGEEKRRGEEKWEVEEEKRGDGKGWAVGRSRGKRKKGKEGERECNAAFRVRTLKSNTLVFRSHMTLHWEQGRDIKSYKPYLHPSRMSTITLYQRKWRTVMVVNML